MKSVFAIFAVAGSVVFSSLSHALTIRSEGGTTENVDAIRGPSKWSRKLQTKPKPDPGDGGGGSNGGVTCPANGIYTGTNKYSVLTAAPLRGVIGCINAPALARRSQVVVGGSTQVPVSIYGPFEAGFSSSDPGASCLGTNTVAGGIDTGLADAIISYLCKAKMEILDYCGGHAVPYHYHQSMDCLYVSSTDGHSTKIGTAIDGNPIYGRYIEGGKLPTDLDACGGRVGKTPDSPNVDIYYYVVQEYAPFTVGCFGSKNLYPVTLAQCRAVYAGCTTADVTLTTDYGSGYYRKDCPCFDSSKHSNTDANKARPGYLPPSTEKPSLEEIQLDFTLKGLSSAKVNSSAVLKASFRRAIAVALRLDANNVTHLGVYSSTKSLSSSDGSATFVLQSHMLSISTWPILKEFITSPIDEQDKPELVVESKDVHFESTDSCQLKLTVRSLLNITSASLRLRQSSLSGSSSYAATFIAFAKAGGYTDSDIDYISIDYLSDPFLQQPSADVESNANSDNTKQMLALLALFGIFPLIGLIYYVHIRSSLKSANRSQDDIEVGTIGNVEPIETAVQVHESNEYNSLEQSEELGKNIVL